MNSSIVTFLLRVLLLYFVVFSGCATAKELERKVKVNGIHYTVSEGWHANGNKWYRYYYRRGEKSLTHKNWHLNGQLSEETSYLHNFRHGISKSWHDNGKRSEVAHYRFGSRTGKFMKFFRNGRAMTIANYNHGLRDGNYQHYYKDGKLKYSGNFRKGNAHGEFTEFDATDRKIKTHTRQLNRKRPPRKIKTKIFSLMVADGSGHEGFRFNFKLREDGLVIFSFLEYVTKVQIKKLKGNKKRYEKHRQAQDKISEFFLSQAEQTLILQKIIELELFGFNKAYINKALAGGNQGYLKIKLGERIKHVEFSNAFPDNMRAFQKFLQVKILDAHRLELLASRVAPPWKMSSNFDLPQ